MGMEINDDNTSDARIHHDVTGLEVGVHDAQVVQNVQCIGCLHDNCIQQDAMWQIEAVWALSDRILRSLAKATPGITK